MRENYLPYFSGLTALLLGDDKENKEACHFANVVDETSKKTYRRAHVFSCNDGYAETAPAGAITANHYDLKDILGNVWEWTCSTYEETYGEQESQCATDNDSRPRVIRGGS